ncbi:hypothetical protein D9611_003080 [Ephemerocybe angulata]|uniref:SET domain-containing protein n=2 Tax=Ephemerocybe angulata TaxID=980116 RepID=A0A8H5C7Y6_9AGAR|nr:hypothetical protein D9611_012115 [Tulosesus angulatus]KAF5336872.1 hypothetical protein D9611_003080 [Tulosesus angulatus]KAF6749779.1 hypothetical protein DFP72DRAFT_1073000 [Tulosesus angulatus]
MSDSDCWGRDFALLIIEGVAPVSSAHAIAMEDLVVQALFSPCRLFKHGTHRPQTLGVSFNAPAKALQQLYQSFESQKTLFLSEAPEIIQMASHIVRLSLEDHHTDPYYSGLEGAALDVLEWCISAYGALLNPRSQVKLKVIPMDTVTKGFSLFARRDIPKGSYVWEAMGMVPADNASTSTLLSTTETTAEQNQPSGEERVLYGPVRMINHRCKTYNVAFAAHDGTSAFIVYALRPIVMGQELTLNYGSGWFEESCPCTDCTPLECNTGRISEQMPASPRVPGPAQSILEDRFHLVAELKAELKAEGVALYREQRRQESESRRAEVMKNRANRRRRNLKKKKGGPAGSEGDHTVVS